MMVSQPDMLMHMLITGQYGKLLGGAYLPKMQAEM